MQTSDSIKSISKALLTFHKEVEVIKKTEENKFFKNKYADLATILTAIDEPLQKAGLTFVQVPECGNKLTTRIIHAESGEWLEGTYDMTPKENSPQAQGSVITYLRRYSLSAILGLNVDEDDDGNKSSGYTAPTATKKYAVASPDYGTQAVEKECPFCGAKHTGRYPKCLSCFTKEKETGVKLTKLPPKDDSFPEITEEAFTS